MNMKRTALVVCAALLAALPIGKAEAAVYQPHSATHKVDKLRVVHIKWVQKNALLDIRFNDGSGGLFSPCWVRSQVRGNCYWTPTTRVDTYGKAWVIVRSERVPISQRVLREAGLA